MRELTKNSIEAIQRTASKKGEIHWDLDWNRFELTNGAETKLCIIDNGVGMTGEEMVNYINQLSSSVHLQSRTKFWGRSKDFCRSHEPHGLVYLSWSEGRGYMIHPLEMKIQSNMVLGVSTMENSGKRFNRV